MRAPRTQLVGIVTTERCRGVPLPAAGRTPHNEAQPIGKVQRLLNLLEGDWVAHLRLLLSSRVPNEDYSAGFWRGTVDG